MLYPSYGGGGKGGYGQPMPTQPQLGGSGKGGGGESMMQQPWNPMQSPGGAYTGYTPGFPPTGWQLQRDMVGRSPEDEARYLEEFNRRLAAGNTGPLGGGYPVGPGGGSRKGGPAGGGIIVQNPYQPAGPNTIQNPNINIPQTAPPEVSPTVGGYPRNNDPERQSVNNILYPGGS